MQSSIRDKIIQELSDVYDPEILTVDIWNLGLIYDISTVDEQGRVTITMTLTSAFCPEAETIPATVKQVIESLEEISEATVNVVFDPPWSPNRASDVAKIKLGWTEE